MPKGLPLKETLSSLRHHSAASPLAVGQGEVVRVTELVSNALVCVCLSLSNVISIKKKKSPISAYKVEQLAFGVLDFQTCSSLCVLIQQKSCVEAAWLIPEKYTVTSKVRYLTGTAI